jgi:peptidyl-prolyl cis-trans isomerase B (cyclophilin B)
MIHTPLAVALGLVAAALAAEPDTHPLDAVRLYNGVNRPLSIDVRAPEEALALTLSLQAADGQVLAEPIAIEPGRHDLAEIMPGIWNLRRAAYLQLLADGQPAGAAIVLQPLLTRMVPVLEPAVRADGTPFWSVAEFVAESEDAERLAAGLPVFEIAEPAPGEAATRDERAPANDDDDDDAEDAPPDDVAGPPPLVFSGIRAYPERDVILHTDYGDIRLAMAPDAAPNTAWNFMHLAAGGFYDQVSFHRIVPFDRQGRPFVIQAGDPSETGSGGPGYWLPMEPSNLPHDFGVISMARDVQPDSAGSQIFICLSREGTARLDGQYCAFGYAVDGAETIKSIADVELLDVARGRPRRAPVILSAKLVPAPPRRPGLGRPDARISPEDPEPVRTRPPRVPR